MLRFLPGDELWGRYRVEWVAADVIEAARLGPLVKADGARQGALLLSLEPSARHPLAEFLLACRRAGFLAESTDQDAQPGNLPWLGKVEWLSEPLPGNMVLLDGPPAIELAGLVHKTGALPPHQVLTLLFNLADSLNQLLLALRSEPLKGATSSSRATWPAEPLLWLCRLLNPGNVAFRTKDTRPVFALGDRLSTGGGQAFAPDGRLLRWVEFIAPELYRGQPATPAAVVFALAQLACYCARGGGTRTWSSAPEAWAALAAWSAGKRHPSRELLADPQLAQLPPELLDVLAKALRLRPSQRLRSLGRLLALLKPLRNCPWAQAPRAACPHCSFILSEPGAACPCCGCPRAHSERELDGPPSRKPERAGRKSRKGNTTAVLRARSAPVQTALVVATPGMTVIPAGPFLSGEQKVTRTLSAFTIDLTPVTEGAYKAYLAETGKKPRPDGPGSRAARFDLHPVTGVTWPEASAFATYHGKRLPTRFEWEKAARGTNGRKYPWGDEFGAGRGCLRPLPGRNQISGTVPVGNFPAGASPYGVLDMGGLVLEWTSSARRAGEQIFRAVKGASFLDGAVELARCASLQYLPLETNLPNLGFRCVKDVE